MKRKRRGISGGGLGSWLMDSTITENNLQRNTLMHFRPGVYICKTNDFQACWVRGLDLYIFWPNLGLCVVRALWGGLGYWSQNGKGGQVRTGN